ncbi:type II secretion system protein [Parashewanella tropica]|uniref:type II secretion system protein n=1 Tax=Parashewanella tropica TaxID=2547970 RepID=UPI001059BD73|nr:type II secretion system protein [Parashewanella tropica]
MKQKQQGFTLIELVVVIIILGILAVTAAPKFIDLQEDARKSTLQGVQAALQGANQLLNSKAQIQRKAGKANQDITVDGGTVTASFGYLNSVDDTAKVKANLEKVMDMTFATATAGTAVSGNEFGVIYKSATSFFIIPQGKKDSDNCRLEYVPATASTAPTYTVKSTDC